MMKRYVYLVVGLLFLLTGCIPEIQKISGYIEPATKIVQTTAHAARPISDSEEYYLGRAVAAKILSVNPLLEGDYNTWNGIKNTELTEYVNLIGQTVARNSDKPDTFAGYHFAIIDSEEVNAFACPGGIIFITKGMLRLTTNEDELAAVLAHEVAHINHSDGVSSIKSSRWTGVLTLIGTTAAKEYASRDVAQLVSLFEGSIDDVFKTLVVTGYSREQEYEADAAALVYLTRAGYNPQALLDFLNRLNETGSKYSGGILQTHPGTMERIDKVTIALSSEPAQMPQPPIHPIEERNARYKTVMNMM